MNTPAPINEAIENRRKSSIEKWINTRKGLTFRVSRLWVLDGTNDGQKMELQFIAIDKKSRAFLCSIEEEDIDMFEPFIEEGSVYTIRNFGVAKMKPLHRVLNDSDYYLVLDSSTRLDKVCVNVPTILRYKFQLIDYSDLLQVSNDGRHLCDVIGQITMLRQVGTEVIDSTILRTLAATLSDLSGRVLNIEVYTEHSSMSLNSALEQTDRICILTSMIVKPASNRGQLTLTTSDATQILATFRIKDVMEFHTRVIDKMMQSEARTTDHLSQ